MDDDLGARIDAEWLDIWLAVERGPAVWIEWVRMGRAEEDGK